MERTQGQETYSIHLTLALSINSTHRGSPPHPAPCCTRVECSCETFSKLKWHKAEEQLP